MNPAEFPIDLANGNASLLFFISVFWGFFPLFTATFTFPQERAMLAEERSVDMYKLSAYFSARNISDLPLDLILPIIVLVIICVMVGLRPSYIAFSQNMLTVFLCILAAQGLELIIGVAFMDVKKAKILHPFLMTSMLSGRHSYPERSFFLSCCAKSSTTMILQHHLLRFLFALPSSGE
ncbi:hypothetical protein CUMW_047430 [Citrus unshiu]|nr:hypothetical protein CUMW_047430 [Citrus unshiu]